jgi:tRNA (guanine-N7-)-methyltransferase
LRVRRKPGSYEALVEMERVFVEASEAIKGNWNNLFGNDHPIYAEFGGGKGQFIVEMARRCPDKNFIMVDVVPEVALKAAERAEESGLSNVKLTLFDLTFSENYFAPGELAGIYLNFSDPWPKKRHYKRRLTYRSFLEKYKKLLSPDGWIHFKTDNKELFEFSLEEFSALNMMTKDVSRDLHEQIREMPQGLSEDAYVQTEYEMKFSEKGFPIYRVEAQFR